MEPNEVIGDRYEMGDSIARGSRATIFRATDLRMGRLVAVKVLREVYSSDPRGLARFQREARAASALQHPNIVQVFDYGQSGDSYYIVMEYVDGADLRRYLKRQGILSNERAVEIAHDVALGLGAAHRRGIVHRNVKPNSILLEDAGDVKLTSFGIASMYKDAFDERLTDPREVLGSAAYIPPEQIQSKIVSPPADIYALGIVMYEMLAGKTPFDGDGPLAVAIRHIQDAPEPPSRLNPNIAPGLERIILRCLAKDPRDRYHDGDALANALEDFTRTPSSRRGTGAPQRGQYGASAVISGPRGGVSGPPNDGRMSGENVGMYDAPTFEDFDEPMGVGTHPYGQAAGTAPRISGPNGVPGLDEVDRPNIGTRLADFIWGRKSAKQSNSVNTGAPKTVLGPNTRPMRVFISYKSEDGPTVSALADTLGNIGYQVWFDQHLTGGQKWWDEILEKIRTCDLFLFILTPASLDSVPCKLENEYAANLRKRILPLLFADGVDVRLLSPSMQQIQIVDYRTNATQRYVRLLEALRSLPPETSLPSPMPRPPDAPISPLGAFNVELDAKTIIYDRQAALLLSIKAYLKQPDTEQTARVLLHKLAARPDCIGTIADEIRSILG